MATELSTDVIRRAPKVLLHDHLDGGLRPATIVDLAADIGHELPAGNAGALGHWFRESADSGSLERYLETFAHTVAVMQQADAIRRVARECVEDLAADGVLTRLDALCVGVAAWRLGAGRARQGEAVQAGAGIELHAKPGDNVTAGAPLLTLHTDTPDRFDRALEALDDAYEIGQDGVAPADVVIDRVG